MKRYTTCLILASILSFIIIPRIYSQDPDAWEKHQTSYQPPEIVLKAIDLKEGINNITCIRGKEKDPLLPDDALDMIFIVNSYHHFSKPIELLQHAKPALKSSRTLVIIEGVPDRYGSASSHATPKEELISQAKEAGYSFDRVVAELQRDDIYIFRKL